jgi:hypothetical protein
MSRCVLRGWPHRTLQVRGRRLLRQTKATSE